MPDETTPTQDGLGATEREILAQRLKKAEALRALGVNPYGNGLRAAHVTKDLHDRYGQQKTEEIAADPGRWSIAGRVLANRAFGKAAFLKVRDRAGEIQVWVKKDKVGDKAFEVYKLLDVGDVIAAEGPATRTKTGELTVEAATFTILTKSLRPLPEKWHGLTDVEQRYRQRYVDLLVTPGVRDVFIKRARIIQTIRRVLDARGYLEVETPTLHKPEEAGGAAAVRDAPQRPRHGSEAADRDRAAPEAARGRRLRPRLRDRPDLAERGDRPAAQPRVHHHRVLRGLRHPRRPDAAHRGALPRPRDRGDRRREGDVPGTGDRPHAPVPAHLATGARGEGARPLRRGRARRQGARGGARPALREGEREGGRLEAGAGGPEVSGRGAGRRVRDLRRAAAAEGSPVLRRRLPDRDEPALAPARRRPAAGRSLRALRRRHGDGERLLRAERPRRPARPLRGTAEGQGGG